MAFHLKDSESIEESVQRIADDELNDALALLRKRNVSLIEKVHEVRKSTKKLRALLRLIRSGVSGALYRFENGCFRDMGHQLSDARDAQILIECIEKLRKSHRIAAPVARPVQRALLQNRDGIDALLKGKNVLESLAGELEAARERVPQWRLKRNKRKTIYDGFSHTYKSGRKALVAALETPEMATYHTWRKRVKALNYHARMLQPLWPELMDKLEADTGKLGELLGDDHDLAVLKNVIQAAPAVFGGKQIVRSVSAAVNKQSRDLRAEAVVHGEKIYAETTKVFLARFDAP